jgi:hypothetical protein
MFDVENTKARSGNDADPVLYLLSVHCVSLRTILMVPYILFLGLTNCYFLVGPISCPLRGDMLRRSMNRCN